MTPPAPGGGGLPGQVRRRVALRRRGRDVSRHPQSVRPDDIGPAHVFRVAPTKVLGFGKRPFSQTRWRFTG